MKKVIAANMDLMSHQSYLSQERYPISNAMVKLQNKKVWDQFFEFDTEMIITKNGRRMFPTISCLFEDLDPNANYCVFLELELASPCRYKYSSSVGWAPAGTEEAQSSQRLYLHPESPASGEHWMKQAVSFHRLKLTNTCSPPQGHVVLSSMHRYQPKVIIVKTSNPGSIRWSPQMQFVFEETQFVAVTAYQNDRITSLKIDHNPFAKGFRVNGKSNRKRKLKNSEEEIIEVVEMEARDVRARKSRSRSPVKPSSCRPKGNLAQGVVPVGYNCCMPVSTPYYHHPGHYAPLWMQPVPYYYPLQHPVRRQEAVVVREEVEEVRRPRIFTDFSIKAITGSP